MSAEYTLTVGTTEVQEDVLLAGGVRFERGLDGARVLDPPRAGSADITLDNADLDYLPGVIPFDRGDMITLTAEHDGQTYDLWTGILDDPEQRFRDFSETVSLSGLGTLSRVAGKRGLRSELFGFGTGGIRVDEAIGHVLDLVGWPAGDRVLDQASTTLRLWYLDGDGAMEALRDLVNSEGPTAKLYEDAQGRIVFKNRHAVFLEERSADVQSTYGGASGFPIIDEPTFSDGRRDLVNTATIQTVRRQQAPLEVIWEAGEPVQMAGNGIRSFDIRVQRIDVSGDLVESDDLITAAVTPVEGTDYTITTGSLVNVSLNRTSGATVRLTINAGAGGAIVEGLRLRAHPLRIVNRTSVVDTRDAVEDEVRPYPFRVRPDIDSNLAQDLVNFIVDHYKDGRPKTTFTTLNLDDPSLVSILSREVGDRVRIIYPRQNVDIEAIVLQRTDSIGMGRIHRVAFGCEEAVNVTEGLFQFDLEGAGFDQGMFTV